MLNENKANADVTRIAQRVVDGTLAHPILTDIIGRADQYPLSHKQVALLLKIEDEQDNPRPKVVAIGNLGALVLMLQHAKQHLKFPKFRMRRDENGGEVVVSLAGERGANPGWVYVKSEGGYHESTYYGKINPHTGEYFPTREAPTDVGSALVKFADDPAGVASDYGRLSGNCCFCMHSLKDERSTSVGYGPECAKHYALPWGTK